MASIWALLSTRYINLLPSLAEPVFNRHMRLITYQCNALVFGGVYRRLKRKFGKEVFKFFGNFKKEVFFYSRKRCFWIFEKEVDVLKIRERVLSENLQKSCCFENSLQYLLVKVVNLAYFDQVVIKMVCPDAMWVVKTVFNYLLRFTMLC